MRKMIGVLFALLAAMMLVSCDNDDEEDDGTLIVKNECAADSNVYVTSVFVSEKDDFLFPHEYSCKIAPGRSWSVDIEPGKYAVGIRTRALVGDVYAIHYYMKTTGLNNYRCLDENGYLVVGCDKVGVWFE